MTHILEISIAILYFVAGFFLPVQTEHVLDPEVFYPRGHTNHRITWVVLWLTSTTVSWHQAEGLAEPWPTITCES